MAYWFILSLSLNENVYGDRAQLRLWPSPTGAPRTSKLIRSDVLTARFILTEKLANEGQMGPLL